MFKPVPGKFIFDLTINGIAKLIEYRTDASGECAVVQRAGSYRARVAIPVSCMRRLTDAEREEAASACDQGFF